MSTVQVYSVIKKIQGLPPLPHAVTKLYQLTNDLQSDSRELISVISSDEALSSKILKLSNSAFYGLSNKISTISQAVTIIGFYALRDLALGISVIGFWNKSSQNQAISREEFWKHSLTVAVAARQLAIQFRYKNPEEAFIAGLLHEIGRIVFLEYFPQEYSNILEKFNENPNLNLQALENYYMGMDHQDAGKLLCDHWNLPKPLIAAVANHHALKIKPSQLDMLTKIVYLSDNIAKLLQSGFSGSDQVNLEFIATLSEHISWDRAQQLIQALPYEIEKMEVFFELLSANDDKPSFDGEEGEEKKGIILIVEDPAIQKLLGMILIELGYCLFSMNDVRQQASNIAVMIYDQAIPPDCLSIAQEHHIATLSLYDWTKEKHIHIQSILPVREITHWVKNVEHP